MIYEYIARLLLLFQILLFRVAIIQSEVLQVYASKSHLHICKLIFFLYIPFNKRGEWHSSSPTPTVKHKFLRYRTLIHPPNFNLSDTAISFGNLITQNTHFISNISYWSLPQSMMGLGHSEETRLLKK